MQHDHTAVESSNYSAEQRTKNRPQANVSYDPLEPLRKSKNAHDRVRNVMTY